MPKFFTSPPGYELNPAGMAAECRELRAEVDRLRAAYNHPEAHAARLMAERDELRTKLAAAAPSVLFEARDNHYGR